MLSTHPTIRPINLDHLDPFIQEVPTEPGAVGPGPLDSNSIEIAKASDPRMDLSVSLRRCFELLRAEDPAARVDHRCVVRVTAGIESADDNQTVLYHAVPASSRGHAPVVGGTGH